MKPPIALRTGAALAAFLLPALAFAADAATPVLGAKGLLAAFGNGLATAATPCVYPMVGITVSVFGAKRASRGRAIALSAAFVAGITALFVPLGLLAALTGSVAGSVAGSHGFQIGTAVLLLVMAGSMFGLFDVSLPSSVQNRLASIGGSGLGGAFLIGLALGPIAAPCATAGLAAILSYVAQTRDVASGALALFVYSLGLGLPFFLVGAFAVGLPKPGKWMDYVKSVFGVALIALGLHYLSLAFPALHRLPAATPAVIGAGIAVVIAGLAIGAIHLSLKEGPMVDRVRKFAGILLVGPALFVLGSVEPAQSVGSCAPVAWQYDATRARASARASNRPMVIDFGATWCPACEELAHRTFTAGEVACAVGELGFVPLKLYDDDRRDPNFDALQHEYSVVGFPTVIVLNAHGREVARETRFVPPAEMNRLLHRAETRESTR